MAHIEEIKKDCMALAEELEAKARAYCVYRQKASDAKIKIDVIMATHLKELREVRSNIGHEMALIHLMEPHREDSDEIEGYYRDYSENSDHYKSLERLIGALETRISVYQSIMKFERENT